MIGSRHFSLIVDDLQMYINVDVYMISFVSFFCSNINMLQQSYSLVIAYVLCVVYLSPNSLMIHFLLIIWFHLNSMFWFIFKSALINSVCVCFCFLLYMQMNMNMNIIIFNTDSSKAINKEHSNILFEFVFFTSSSVPSLSLFLSASFSHFSQSFKLSLDLFMQKARERIQIQSD